MTKFWYDAPGALLGATSDSATDFPGSTGHTTVAPTDGAIQRWNGTSWEDDATAVDQRKGAVADNLLDAAILKVELALFLDLEQRMRAAGQTSTIPEVAAATNKAEYRQALRGLVKGEL